MRPLSAHDILQVWEQGQGQHPVDRALTLLSAGCPDMTWEALARLTIGQRDARLLTLREQTFGASMRSWATCPQCAERLEFTVAASDIRVTAQPDAAPQCFALELEDLQVQVRPPTSEDLAAVARCESADGVRDVLVQRCVLQANRDGRAVMCSELPTEALSRLAEYLAVCDPQAEVLLNLTCPACRHHWQMPFDIATFFWAELCAQAKRLLREVHLLARAYGWREADIIAMSAARRSSYLEMLT